MNGAEMIAAERDRQIEVEGWTAGHDDGHDSGALAVAAACYALHAGHTVNPMRKGWYTARCSVFWPFLQSYWKPKDPVRDLARAGALIAAEIDRLTRRQYAEVAEKEQGG